MKPRSYWYNGISSEKSTSINAVSFRTHKINLYSKVPRPAFISVLEVEDAAGSFVEGTFSEIYEVQERDVVCIKRRNSDGTVACAFSNNTVSGEFTLPRSEEHSTLTTDADFGVIVFDPKRQAIRTSRLYEVSAVEYDGVEIPIPLGPEDAEAAEFQINRVYRFDLGISRNVDGPCFSPVEEGYTRISGESVYDPAVGYGWDTQKEQTCPNPYLNHDAEPYPFHVPLLLDFNVVEGPDDDVFSVDVPNGTYTVTITTGDLCFPHFLDVVKAEGEVKLTNISMEKAEFIESSFTVDVADGQLNITFIDDDGESPINAIVIEN